jgi:hypothetical protein
MLIKKLCRNVTMIRTLSKSDPLLESELSEFDSIGLRFTIANKKC